ncbi:possible stress-responsive transcriptional regulator [Secundilactobacillus oryzae JCM 18671]|uniref:Possible stress-responsive transcriptional regulator n=1 Tax=Secundilactobacillus oryzae JCM 18671 TaxID=1291743 RepID=A0A081BK34_9LACO|nr:PspC domain-containing protein [Secundilactobacillus oryzae]GAK48402.1 possible stress-responsive transcriptional regulator [Secundilactobacillus oryzae JCM 18671]
MAKQLTRSDDRIIAGALGGLAEYFGINPTLVRVLYVVLSVFPGHVIGGILIYALLVTFIPSKRSKDSLFNTMRQAGQTRQSNGRKTLNDVEEEDKKHHEGD